MEYQRLAFPAEKHSTRVLFLILFLSRVSFLLVLERRKKERWKMKGTGGDKDSEGENPLRLVMAKHFPAESPQATANHSTRNSATQLNTIRAVILALLPGLSPSLSLSLKPERIHSAPLTMARIVIWSAGEEKENRQLVKGRTTSPRRTVN